jgi:hypothetical protein
MKRIMFVAVVMAACGGSEKAADKTTPMPEGEHGKDHDKEHAKLTPELNAFHDVLAPRWHADPGEARVTDTCAAQPEMLTKSQAVEAAAPPADVDAAVWTDAAHKLTAVVEALGQTCAGDRTAFDAAFSSVHDGFHYLMELQMGKHPAKMEHEHGAETGGMKH